MKHQCIECGSKVDHLYKDFSKGIIMISHCKSCRATADKYVEYDKVIVVLDVLLLQPQAYRHLLINTPIKHPWKLALILLVCDAFVKLVMQRVESKDSDFGTLDASRISYIGFGLYINYIISALELLFLLGAVCLVYGLKSLVYTKSLKFFNFEMLKKAVIVASLGRILTLPGLLWGELSGALYMWMCRGFVCLSTAQALRVVDEGTHRTFWSTLAVLLGFSTQLFISWALHLLFEKELSFTLNTHRTLADPIS